MISKIFPRILNKSSDKTAIKPSEFSDALNVLVTGDDGGDGNVISKGDGNITALINDPTNFPINGNNGTVLQEKVIGKYEDQKGNRVYYFSYGEEAGSNVGYSSVYLLEKINQSEYRFALLLRGTTTDGSNLDFSKEDFIPANIIQTPVLKKEYYRDVSNSGDQGDTDSEFDFEGTGGDVDPIVNLSVTQIPVVEQEVPIGNAQDLVCADGSMTISNFGTASGEVSLTGVITNGINGAYVDIAADAVIQPNGNVIIPFSICLDLQQYGGIGLNGEVEIFANISVVEVAGTFQTYGPLNESYNVSTTIVFPEPVDPTALIVTSSLDPNGPVNVVGIDSTQAPLQNFGLIPENQYATTLGPFNIKLRGWETGGVVQPYYSRVRVRAFFSNGEENEQGVNDFWEIINVDDVDIWSSQTDYDNPQEIFENPYGIQDQELMEVYNAGSFYLRKSHDTNGWPDPGSEFNPFVGAAIFFEVQKYNSNTEQWEALSVSTTPGDAGQGTSIHSARASARIEDIPTPSDIKVISTSWGDTYLRSIQPNVDDGTGTYSGSSFQESIVVRNFGETGGWYYPEVDWAKLKWNILSSTPILAAWTQAQDSVGYNANDAWEGGAKLISVSYSDVVNERPYSSQYLLNGIVAANTAFGEEFDWINTSPTPVYLGPGDQQIITFTFSNESPEYAYGLPYLSGFSDDDDTPVGGPTEGVTGPFYFWGQPDTTNTILPNGQIIPNKDDFYFKVKVLNEPDLADPSLFVETPMPSVNYIQVLVGDGYLGDLSITTSKTPEIGAGHPVYSSPWPGILANAPFDGGSVGFGPYEGQRKFYIGMYDVNGPTFHNYPIAANSGAGTNGNSTDDFWIGGGAFSQQCVDFSFSNNSLFAQSQPVYLEVKLYPLPEWGYGIVGEPNNPEFDFTGEWGSPNFTFNRHVSTSEFPGTDGVYGVFTGGLGSIGPSVIFSNPIPHTWLANQVGSIDAAGVANPDTNEYINFWTHNKEGVYSPNYPAFVNGDAYAPSTGGIQHNGAFRFNSTSIPANHTVQARIVFKYQRLGDANPTVGMNRFLVNPEVEYLNNPQACWGMPAIVRARWSGGVNNPSPTFEYRNLGVAVGFGSFEQFNTAKNA